MAWYDGKIMREADFDVKPEPTNTRFQYGDYVWVQFVDPERSDMKYADVPGRIAGVHIRKGNQVLYDVAVPIAGTPYYAVMENLQGQIVGRARPVFERPGPANLTVVK
jgi:hypothetical protein